MGRGAGKKARLLSKAFSNNEEPMVYGNEQDIKLPRYGYEAEIYCGVKVRTWLYLF